MRAHNNDFKNEIKNYGRQFTDRIWWYGISQVEELTDNEITYINYNVNTSLFKSVMQELTFETTYNGNIGIPIYYDCELEGVTGSPIQFKKFNQVKKEERKDTKSYRYTCYDNMIKTMKDYETFLNATSDNTFTTDKNYYYYDNNESKYKRYTSDRTGNPSSLGLYESAFPMTIRDYINAICTRVGITFADASNTFTNYDKNVLQEHYVDVDLNSMGYTYRDVLDDLAEATGSFICININGQLCIKGITNTNDTIDENYFKDSNVNIGKHYGAINVVVLSRNDSDNLYYPSTIPQDPVEIKINDNPILEQTNREDFIQGIYNNVNGLEFYLNDFNSTGIMYYEVGDLYNVSIDGTTYPCLMLNDSITRDGGLTEKIYTEEPTTSVTEYKYASDTDKLEKTSRNAYFLADKANGVASMIVEGIGSNGQVTGASVIASINDDTSNLSINADKIKLEGYTTINNSFAVDNNGSVEMTGGSIHLVDDSATPWNSVLSVSDENDENEASISSTIINVSNSTDNSSTRIYKDAILISNYNDDNTANEIYLKNTSSTTLNDAYVTGTFMQYDANGNVNNYADIDARRGFRLWKQGVDLFGVYSDGSIFTRDSNNNQTFYVDSSTGDTTTSGDIVADGTLKVKYAKDLSVESLKSKNLFNQYKRINDTYVGSIASCLSNYTSSDMYGRGYFNANWTLSNDANWFIGFTPCESGKTYTISNSAGTMSCVAFINSSGTITANSNDWVTSYTHTATSSEAYIILGANKSALGSIQIEEGSSKTTLKEYKGYGYVRGGNSNGSYIKYDDGTLIQWGEKQWTTNVTTSYGSIYHSTDLAHTFPVSFYSSNYTFIATALSSGMLGVQVHTKNTTTANCQVFNPASWSNASFTVEWYAIGRWK